MFKIFTGLFSKSRMDIEVSKSKQTIYDLSCIYDIKINDIFGNPIRLEKYRGKKIFFVNVAHHCLFSYQYRDLYKLSQMFSGKLIVVILPSNQFLQDFRSEETIRESCKDVYSESFILTEKVYVKGNKQHLLYTWLTKKINNGVLDSSVLWNFHKYLVDEEGFLMASFGPSCSPVDLIVIQAINDI